MSRKGTDGGELAKLYGPGKTELLNMYLDLATTAYAMGGRRALELPAPRTTAAHESGHAVLHATVDDPIYQVSIWYVPAANGYAGACDFVPGSPEIRINACKQPHEALRYAANLVAGPLAELLLAADDYRHASSLDEWLGAGAMIKGASVALACDPHDLYGRVTEVVWHRLTAERGIMEKLQRLLLQQGRVRGPKLTAILVPVHRLDLVAAILLPRKGAR